MNDNDNKIALNPDDPDYDPEVDEEGGWICNGCGQGEFSSLADLAAGGFCSECQARIPHPLLKATYEPSDYAVGLKNTQGAFNFHMADIFGEWISLDGWGMSGIELPPDFDAGQITVKHGFCVRLEQIEWACEVKPTHRKIE